MGMMHRWRGGCRAAGRLGLVIAGVGVASTVAAESPSDLLIRERVAQLSIQTSRSASGRFVVVCPDTRLHMPVLQWAERIYVSVQRVVGGALVFEGRQMVIQILEEGAEPFLGAEATTVMLRQRLELPASMLGHAEADEWLVRALLAVHPRDTGAWVALPLPEWLWMGVAGQLTQEARARAMDTALVAWRTGRLAPPAQLMGLDGLEPVTDAAAAVALVRWWGSQQRKSRFATLFETLAASRTAAAAAAHVVRELSGPGEVTFHDAWEVWLSRERDVVHAAGMVSARLLRRFEAELLLSEGVCGIPGGVLEGRVVGFADLPHWREEPWFGLFAREKRAQLEMLVSGRGAPLIELAAAYDRYLADVASGRASVEQSLQSLRTADAMREALAEELERVGGLFFVSPGPAGGSAGSGAVR